MSALISGLSALFHYWWDKYVLPSQLPSSARPQTSRLDFTRHIEPLYFTRDIGGEYHVATPQPTVFGDPCPSNHGLYEEIEGAAANAVAVQQLKFLLSQAPLIDAPSDFLRRMSGSVTKFGYIHPLTMAKFQSTVETATLVQKRKTSKPASAAGYITIGSSPTRWVLTTLMPEDRIIFSQNPLPGLEKTLTKQS